MEARHFPLFITGQWSETTMVIASPLHALEATVLHYYEKQGSQTINDGIGAGMLGW